MENALYLDESTLNRYPKDEYLKYGDTIINSTGTGTLGRVGFFNASIPKGINGIVPDSHVTKIRIKLCNKKYIYFIIKINQEFLENQGEGSTNQKELKPHTIFDLPIPLPPLKEQSKIVAKIEELFSALDQIERNLV